MDDLILDLNHTYLLRYGCTDTVSSVTILMVANKAYKVRWNGSGSEIWELKRRISADFSLVEDITDYIVPKQEDLKFEDIINIINKDFKYKIIYKDVDVKWHPYFLVEENCKICDGSGQIPNYKNQSTSCYKICPTCIGSGKQSKRVDILFE